MPYQSLGVSAGALFLMMAWIRSPVASYGSGIAAILARTVPSPAISSSPGAVLAAALFPTCLEALFSRLLASSCSGCGLVLFMSSTMEMDLVRHLDSVARCAFSLWALHFIRFHGAHAERRDKADYICEVPYI